MKLKKDQEYVAQLMKAMTFRGVDFNGEHYLALLANKREVQIKTEALQGQRNSLSSEVGKLKSKQQDASHIIAEMVEINEDLADHKMQLETLQSELEQIDLSLPNPLDPCVPKGTTEDDNKIISSWGKPRKFSFPIKDHVDIGSNLGLMDFNKAAEISQSRFVFLRGDIARLHRALVQMMLDIHTNEFGYEEMNVPFLVNQTALFDSGQLPKFAEDLFFIEGKKLALIPTSEVPLVNMLAHETIEEHLLPIKFVCHSPCFRSEAGSYGKDTRGMIRQHQFEKVELIQIVSPEQSNDAHESICAHAEHILQCLELPYQKVLKCSGDTGFTAAKTYDLEVWLPSQKCYREISSISNCKDFQAKRMKGRWKNKQSKEKGFVHTLNGSGLAIGRTLVAVLENYQNEDGSVSIPKILQPYMGGINSIIL